MILHWLIEKASDVQRLIARLLKLDLRKKYEVKVQIARNPRTLAQNRLYWKWLTEISHQAYYVGSELHDPYAWHLFFKRRWLGYKSTELPDGEIIEQLESTKDLDTKEFTKYLESIEYFANDELELILPRPDDLWWKAMGINPTSIQNDKGRFAKTR